MIEDKLRNFKDYYLKGTPGDEQVNLGWKKLQAQLDSTPTQGRFYFPYFKQSAAFLAILIFCSTALVSLAQAADPGTPLYPVKLLADQIAAKVTDQPQLKVEKRAQDVINISKKQSSSPKLNEAAKQYNKTLDQTAKEVEDNPTHKQEFNKALNKQEKELDDAIKQNPQSEKELQKVLEDTKRVKNKLEYGSEREDD